MAKKKEQNYMSREERREYLTWIVNAKTDIAKIGNQFFEVYVHPDGRKEIITNADRQRAISILNKMGDV